MSFGVSFLTGALQKQLDNWSADDERIGKVIEGLNDKLVTADDNATQKVDKLGNVAGILNAAYGKNGIYQLAYHVDNNSIDFNQDAKDIAKDISQYTVDSPMLQDYIQKVGNPYEYLGEYSQNLYDNSIAVYANLSTNANLGKAQQELLIPEKNVKNQFVSLQDAPTIGAEPITSMYPMNDKKDYQNNAYNKLAYLIEKGVSLQQGTSTDVPEAYRLTDLDVQFITNETGQAESIDDIVNDMFIAAATDKARLMYLNGSDKNTIMEKITEILPQLDTIEPEPVSANQVASLNNDPVVNSLINGINSNVIVNENALSNYQKNLPRTTINFDTMSNEEANDILNSVTDTTILEFVSRGITYYVEI